MNKNEVVDGWLEFIDDLWYCKLDLGPGGTYHFNHPECHGMAIHARYPLIEDNDGLMICQRCNKQFPYTKKQLVTMASMWEMGNAGSARRYPRY